MERIEADGRLLTWERHGDGARLAVAPAGRPGRATPGGATFLVLATPDGLRLRLALLPTERSVDVSLQPGVFTQVLPVGCGTCPDGSAEATVARWIAGLARERGRWWPEDPAATGLVGVAGGTALPLLGVAYDAGAAVLAEVPRWAAPVLGAPTPRDAARAGWGAKGTRSVARALAAGLVVRRADAVDTVPDVGVAPPAGTVGLRRLAAALMGDRVLDPDRLARVLTSGGPSPATGGLPDARAIDAGRDLLGRLGPSGAERVLAESLGSPRGMAVLDELCRLAPGVVDRLPVRPPGRLDALADLCRGLVPLDPDPSAARFGPVPPSPTGRARPAIGHPVRRPAGRPVPAPVEHAGPPGHRHRARTAPAAPAVDTVGPLRPTPAVAALHGVEIEGDLRLVVPRTTDELAAWGRVLYNCIGSFGPAVAAGRSVLVGVERDGCLTWCLEATPQGEVRQFLGARNRAVPPPVAAAVCARLVRAGIVAPDRADNRLWLGA